MSIYLSPCAASPALITWWVTWYPGVVYYSNGKHGLPLNPLWWEIQSVWLFFLNRNLLCGPDMLQYLLVPLHPSQRQVHRPGLFQLGHPVTIYLSQLRITAVRLPLPQIFGQSPCFHKLWKEVCQSFSLQSGYVSKLLFIFSQVQSFQISQAFRNLGLMLLHTCWHGKDLMAKFTGWHLRCYQFFETKPLCQQHGHIILVSKCNLNIFFCDNNLSGYFIP